MTGKKKKSSKHPGKGEEHPRSRIDLACETLKGDLRDSILREFKAMPKVWQKMAEHEQERLICRANDIAESLLLGACEIMASRGFEHYLVQLGKITVDKGIEAKITATFSPELIAALSSRRGDVLVLIARDVNEFRGERDKAEPDNVGDLAMPRKPEDDERQEPQRLLPPPEHFNGGQANAG